MICHEQQSILFKGCSCVTNTLRWQCDVMSVERCRVVGATWWTLDLERVLMIRPCLHSASPRSLRSQYNCLLLMSWRCWSSSCNDLYCSSRKERERRRKPHSAVERPFDKDSQLSESCHPGPHPQDPVLACSRSYTVLAPGLQLQA